LVKAFAAVAEGTALKLVMMSYEPKSAVVLRADEMIALAVAWALSRTRRNATAREVCLMVGLLMLT